MHDITPNQHLLEKGIGSRSGLNSAELKEVEEHAPALLKVLATKSMPFELCITVFCDLGTTMSKWAQNGTSQLQLQQAVNGINWQAGGSCFIDDEASMHMMLVVAEELLLRIAAELPAQTKSYSVTDLPRLSELTAALAVFWDCSKPRVDSHSGGQWSDTDFISSSPPWSLTPKEKTQLIASLPQRLCSFLCGLPDEASRPAVIGACLVNLFRTKACKDETLLLLRRKLQRCVHR